MAKNLDQIIDMIKSLDLQDDGIRMNQKIKSIGLDFCNLIKDEQMLSDSMDYINEKVLEDSDAALKFAMLFSSRNFDSYAMHDTKVRCKMLKILENNFSNAETFKRENKNLLYNSITLLGEYYHRVRLADESPINILGTSLLQLLIQEIAFDDKLNDDSFAYPDIDFPLAKLILSQVTLNGLILRENHRNELNTLLFYIRKNLIEQINITAASKALLLMTLDLYYNNFKSLTSALEDMYTKYLIEEPSNERVISNIQESPKVNKKWSELVCEDSLLEIEGEEPVSNNNSFCNSPNNTNEEEFQYQSLPPTAANYRVNEENELKPPPPRDYFPRRANNNRSMSPLDTSLSDNHQGSTQKRYYHNANPNKFNHKNNRHPNRFSAHFDDDKNSVRSEGGSIKAYNPDERNSRPDRNDFDYPNRDRHANTDRNNWDRGSGYHTFDGRRRSNSRNNQREGSYNNNSNNHRNHYNKNTYECPPRFRNMEIPSWRNGSQENRYRSNSKGGGAGGDDSRSSSRNRNFPRNVRQGTYEANNEENYHDFKNNHARGQSPDDNHFGNGRGGGAGNNYNSRQSNDRTNGPDSRPQQSRNFGRSNNDRYGSHNSLSSGDYHTWQNNRGGSKNRNSYRRKSQDSSDTHSLHENNSNSDNNWDNATGNNELVKNARNTTKYMQYLSQKN